MVMLVIKSNRSCHKVERREATLNDFPPGVHKGLGSEGEKESYFKF